jgi:hypothetical protein
MFLELAADSIKQASLRHTRSPLVRLAR